MGLVYDEHKYLQKSEVVPYATQPLSKVKMIVEIDGSLLIKIQRNFDTFSKVYSRAS
jgi:hypothetical protein